LYKAIIVSIYFTLYLFSKGTLAGYQVKNSATVSFSSGGVSQNIISSNEDSFVVDRVVDIKVNWQDLKPVEVSAGDKSRVLTFNIANLGNSEDIISLNTEHNITSDFEVENLKIYIDSNNNNILDDEDKEITSITLKNDENQNVFLVADIPDNNSTIPDALDIETLIATSSYSENNDSDYKDNIDTVFRVNPDSDSGEWIIRNYWPVAKKSATILSSDQKLHTGSIIEYKIDVYIDGDSKDRSIDNIVINDTLEDSLEYVANSLELDGVKLTDESDSDAGAYNSGNIIVNVGTIMGSTHKILSFKVKVK